MRDQGPYPAAATEAAGLPARDDATLLAPAPLDATQLAEPAAAPQAQSGTMLLIAAAGVGAAVSLTLGVYGRVHQATGLTVGPLRLDQMLPAKAGLASVAAALAIAQLVSALWLYGRLPNTNQAPSWLRLAHRWSGTVAFVLSLPIAYHCLWSLGFQTTTPRVIAHSILGCAFYGAFATKLLVLRSKRMPGWALPIVGSTLVTLLVGIWFTSAFWFYALA